MTLSTVQVKNKKPSDKRTIESVLEGSGCFLITEPSPLNSKRFILRMRYPFNSEGKLVDVPLGSWGKDVFTIPEVIQLTPSLNSLPLSNNILN